MRFDRILAAFYGIFSVLMLASAKACLVQRFYAGVAFTLILAGGGMYATFVRWRRPAVAEVKPSRKEKPARPPSLVRSSLTAFALFLLDAFVFNQFVIVLITIVILLPFLLYRSFKDRMNKPRLRTRLGIVGIYCVMVVMIMTANRINNGVARDRTEMLAAACEQYKTGHGKYPGRLDDLVPEFLERVPPAKYTLFSSGFFYVSLEGGHTIGFVAIPPYGRLYYTLETKTWGQTD